MVGSLTTYWPAPQRPRRNDMRVADPGSPARLDRGHRARGAIGGALRAVGWSLTAIFNAALVLQRFAIPFGESRVNLVTFVVFGILVIGAVRGLAVARCPAGGGMAGLRCLVLRERCIHDADQSAIGLAHQPALAAPLRRTVSPVR